MTDMNWKFMAITDSLKSQATDMCNVENASINVTLVKTPTHTCNDTDISAQLTDAV